MALADAPWWVFAAPLFPAAATLIVCGHRAAQRLGIRSLDETPREWMMIVGLLGGVAAAHAGRYAGLLITACIVAAHLAERIAWARFREQQRTPVGT